MERNAPPVRPATYSAAEVARKLRVTPRTVRKYAEGLGAFRVGPEYRFPASTVDLLCKVHAAAVRDLAEDGAVA